MNAPSSSVPVPERCVVRARTIAACIPDLRAHAGLIVCVPSNPADAKGLMKSALRAGDPVIMLEPKALFASKGDVPVGEHYVPFGLARIARTGVDITIVAAGQMVPRSLEAAELSAAQGVQAEVIDLRTIMPLDVQTIIACLRKTHRVLVVDKAWAMCGVGGEIAQTINELAFDEVDAPVGRIHTAPTSHPFAPVLKRAMLVDAPHRRRRAQGHRRHPAGARPLVRHRADVDGGTYGRRRPFLEFGTDEPIIMPFGDLTASEGALVKWLKAIGDAVTEGELVAEIETDKTVVEIEAPASGVLSSIDQPVGAVVPMGGRIGGISK